MAEIKNPDAYFGTIVRNSHKDEYRANDNYFKHISSVGDANDVQKISSRQDEPQECGTNSIEQQLSEGSAESWLLFMDDERLHNALSELPVADVEFLLELSRFHYNLAAFAAANGISKQAASKRFRRIRKKILENL